MRNIARGKINILDMTGTKKKALIERKGKVKDLVDHAEVQKKPLQKGVN